MNAKLASPSVAWAAAWVMILLGFLIGGWIGADREQGGPLWRLSGGAIDLLPFILVLAAFVMTGRAVVRTSRRSKGRAIAGAIAALVGIWILMLPALAWRSPVQPRARVAKAHADVRSIASAVSMYAAHMGTLPSGLTLVTQSSRNARGETTGAFLAAVPNTPQGWSSAYYYSSSVDGTFTVSATGDRTTARVP